MELKQSETQKYTQELQKYGIDPNLAKQAAVVIVNSRRSFRTERGQRIINRVYAQVQANNPKCDPTLLNFLQE